MSKTFPHRNIVMTTRNASKKKAAKLSTPNRYDVLSTAVDEHKTFDPPTAISTSEEPPTEVDDTNLKDEFHLLRDTAFKKFDRIDKDMKGIGYALLDIKSTLTNISKRQEHNSEYHKKVDSQTSILSTLKNYIVAKNKLTKTEHANQASSHNPPNSDFGAKIT